MKRRFALGFACWLAGLTFLAPVFAAADDAGVLSGEELNAWVSGLVAETREEEPLNAPVGEEAWTEDGYAFLFSYATLYYSKPARDAGSVLKAVAVTDAAYPGPRGIALGSDAAMLLAAYGWQNPALMGNGSFAAFYLLNQLPDAAYWSWARHEGDELQTVQCAVHARAGEGRYTDAGLLYHTEGGAVTAIRAYGLDALITLGDVKSNLRAVSGAQAAISGDERGAYWPANAAPAFGANDLLFGGVNYLNWNEQSAERLFGKALDTERVRDDTGALLTTTRREGLTFSYTASADGANARLESIGVSGQIAGPRGVKTGMSLEDAIALFCVDGEGETRGGANVLYGDGERAPTGVAEMGEDGAEVWYRAAVPTPAGELLVTLRMTFTNGRLSEWMLYSW